jgi:hypothetical protein
MHHATVSFHHKNKQVGLGLCDCPLLDAFAHDKQHQQRIPTHNGNLELVIMVKRIEKTIQISNAKPTKWHDVQKLKKLSTTLCLQLWPTMQ